MDAFLSNGPIPANHHALQKQTSDTVKVWNETSCCWRILLKSVRLCTQHCWPLICDRIINATPAEPLIFTTVLLIHNQCQKYLMANNSSPFKIINQWLGVKNLWICPLKIIIHNLVLIGFQILVIHTENLQNLQQNTSLDIFYDPPIPDCIVFIVHHKCLADRYVWMVRMWNHLDKYAFNARLAYTWTSI